MVGSEKGRGVLPWQLVGYIGRVLATMWWTIKQMFGGDTLARRIFALVSRMKIRGITRTGEGLMADSLFRNLEFISRSC